MRLYFKLAIDFHHNIELIANNHVDLENYLKTKFNIIIESIDDESDICIVELLNDDKKHHQAEIRWVTYI
jgi:hypothetical protein